MDETTKRPTHLRDTRVWPEDRERWLRSRRREADRELIAEALAELAEEDDR